MQDLLFDALESGATVVTVNHRLARDLRSRFNFRQLEHGLAAWRTPSIASFDAWCESLWNDCVDAGAHAALRLPGSAQEAALWERIVDESPEGHGLIQTSRTAAQALEAWHLAADWAIAVPLATDEGLNDDCRAFARWAGRYAAELEARGWIDRARLPARLADALVSGTLDAPQRVWLAGFEELTPQQAALVEAMRAAGATIERYVPPAHEAEILALALDDADAELRSAARWARALLERGEIGTIGVVVPGLQQARARVDAIFADYLMPSAVLPDRVESTRPYNISSGRPLGDYPIVATALIALELCAGAVPIERVGALLRSPFLGGAEAELSSRALLDARLRRNGRTAVAASEIRAVATEMHRAVVGEPERPRAHASQDLANRLDAVRSACENITPATALAPSQWAATFAAALSALGWPGERPVSGDERQALEKWWELIATYATLDGVVADERAHGAVRRLARMAAGTDFQPRTDQAPVQILGTLEAAAMRFEHLWITGMHDEEMPATPKPNPFLPIRLQRTHRVARASAERELEFARSVVDGLLAAAPYVIVSHPLSDGDRPLVPSPLVAHLAAQPAGELEWEAAEHLSTIIHASGERESLRDESGPPIAQGAPVHGGTSILKDQAACPFRAFANHRLGARPFERPSPGLDAMERGKLMHEILENFWTERKTHAALVALGEEGLDERIAWHVDRAVRNFARLHPETFSERFAAIERTRLTRITRTWLRTERLRRPFTVVGIEQSETVIVGGITMSVRIDRIDELDDGRRIFIDYKTSRPAWRKWFGDRPDEPQLPIYATTCREVAAVLFVQLKPDEAKFIGIACEDGIVPGVRAFAGLPEAEIGTWEEIGPHWARTLEAIGRRFLNGEAAVAPKEPNQTCRYCEVGPLCRVRDMNAVDGELEEVQS